jgi:hypothetical protein
MVPPERGQGQVNLAILHQMATSAFFGTDHIGSPITYLESTICTSVFIYNRGSGFACARGGMSLPIAKRPHTLHAKSLQRHSVSAEIGQRWRLSPALHENITMAEIIQAASPGLSERRLKRAQSQIVGLAVGVSEYPPLPDLAA